jgi:hypothetical protein
MQDDMLMMEPKRCLIMRHDRAAHQEYAAHVDLHDLVEELRLGFDDIAYTRNPRVVEEHVDAPIPVDGSLCQRHGVAFIGDIATIGSRLSARLLDRSHRPPGGLLVDVGCNYSRALTGEQLRAGSTVSGAGARDQADLAVKSSRCK